MWTAALPRTPPPRVGIDVENSSWVERRGVRHTEWSLRVGDAWVRVKDLRDVRSTLADPDFSFEDDEDDPLRVLPPGCQYRTTFHLVVAAGARLQKHVSVPRGDVHRPFRARAPTLDASRDAIRQLMAHFPPLKPPLQSTNTDYRVTRSGRLTPCASTAAPLHAPGQGGAAPG